MPAPNAAAASTGPSDVVPIAPVRLWDSRPSQPRGTAGVAAGALQPWGVVRIPVDGTPGLAGGAKAIVLNITATGVAGAGYVAVWPCGSGRPPTSNLNVARGEDTANQVTVAVNSTRSVCVSSSVATHLVVDANAYVPSTSAVRAFAPYRAWDTRRNGGGGRVAAGGVLRVWIGGSHGLPVGAGVALVNVTATAALGGGYLTIYPCAAGAPKASALNFRRGEHRANAAWVRLDTSGAMCIRSSVAAHLVVDVSGYAPLRASGVTTVVPDRLVDSRASQGISGPVPAGRTVAFGAGDLTDAQGYRGLLLLNVTVTGQRQAGHVTVWPCGRSAPNASSINFAALRNRANAVAVAPGREGRVCIRSSVTTHVVVDANGYVNPPGASYTYVRQEFRDGMIAAELAVLRATNAARAVGRTCGTFGYFPPAPPLRANRLLADTAQAHADDMATRNFFGHTGSDGSRVAERVSRTGYAWSWLGENLAAGYDSPDAVVAALVDSPRHCSTLMNRRSTQIGISYSYGPATMYRHYWGQVLAAPR